MTEVIMPKMGDGMEEGTLLEWLKKDGDTVKSGEVIGTIQTDKATLELEAPGSGVLTGILLEAGGTISVGKPIAAILKPGESVPAEWGTGARPTAASASSTAEPVAASNGKAPEEPPATVAPQAEPAQPIAGERVKASPLARKIAAEKGIDIGAVKGTGPAGRITEKDVRAFSPAPAASPAAATATVFAPVGEDKVIPLPRLRQITAKRTQQSKQEVPHFYVTLEVDVEKILALREMFEEEESGKVSINDFVVKACARSLRDMPEINVVFNSNNTVTQFAGVHVGIAVAIPDGLTVPVIKNADQLSLRSISAKSKELAKKAKENKLSMDELTGSTFSISNMGMLDVDNFLAIVNQPNSAILAIASVRRKVVANENDEIEVRSRMNITCSFDHRTVDGAIGAKFINVVKSYLENPSRLIS
jgi:pyruvate dehydrogenase E2 component (dihydrolipoamide acetyltransferase)